MAKKSKAAQFLDNQAVEEKDSIHWYYKPVALPLFNGEELHDYEHSEEEDDVRCGNGGGHKHGGNSVARATFAKLFLAPMVLPHKRVKDKCQPSDKQQQSSDEQKQLPNKQQELLEKQQELLRQYLEAMKQWPEYLAEHEKTDRNLQKDGQIQPARHPDTLGQKASKMRSFLEESNRVSALKYTQKHEYSKKTDAYTNPKRYISFYKNEHVYEGDETGVTDVQLVEALYTQQLEYLFGDDTDGLANRLRYLLSQMPEKGAFLLGESQPENEVVLPLAGKILQAALLLAAADRLQDAELYQLLNARFKIPMPVNVAIAGKGGRQKVALPLHAMEQLCSTLCAEGLSQAAARALLPLVQAMPAGRQARSLEVMIQEIERQMRELDGRVYSEQDREKKRQLRAKAQELDDLIGELYDLKEQTEKTFPASSSDR